MLRAFSKEQAGLWSWVLIYNSLFVKVGLIYIEATNLPMHLRIILRKIGKRHTKLYETMELAYFCNLHQPHNCSYFHSTQGNIGTDYFDSHLERHKHLHHAEIHWQCPFHLNSVLLLWVLPNMYFLLEWNK